MKNAVSEFTNLLVLFSAPLLGAETLQSEITLADIEVVEVVGLADSVIDSDEHTCLTEALYFEARNQSLSGKVAVGNVILNRVRSPDFPNTICGVVHQGPLDGSEISLNRCQFSYFCDGLSDSQPTENTLEIAAWDLSNAVADSLLLGNEMDNTQGSTYYHAHYVSPFWADHYTETTAIGDHIFYVHY